MSQYPLVRSHREIVNGPGQLKWALAQIDWGRIVHFKLRGVGSTCTCPRGNKCAECEGQTTVYVVVVAVVHANLLVQSTRWWGFACLNEDVLRMFMTVTMPAILHPKECFSYPGTAETEKAFELALSSAEVQFVSGVHHTGATGHFGTRENGYMEPWPMSFHQWAKRMHNLGGTEAPLTTHGEAYLEQQRHSASDG